MRALCVYISVHLHQEGRIYVIQCFYMASIRSTMYQKYVEKSCQKSSSFFITVQWNAIGILMFENLKAIYAIVRAIFCVILTFIYVPVRGNGVTSQ